MPCQHKFHQYLNLENLDFQPLTLIVGTFNPSWPENNIAEWFYGRVGNNYLWDVLPRLHNPELNLRNETAIEWKLFCSQHRVAITDIITSIDDADEDNEGHREILRTYLDNEIPANFNHFTFTDIRSILTLHPTIKNVYLTRQEGIILFDEQWALLEQYKWEHPDRQLHLEKLLTPSKNARFQIAPYIEANPNDPTPLRNFIYQKWLECWH